MTLNPVDTTNVAWVLSQSAPFEPLLIITRDRIVNIYNCALQGMSGYLRGHGGVRFYRPYIPHHPLTVPHTHTDHNLNRRTPHHAPFILHDVARLLDACLRLNAVPDRDAEQPALAAGDVTEPRGGRAWAAHDGNGGQRGWALCGGLDGRAFWRASGGGAERGAYAGFGVRDWLLVLMCSL